MNTILSRLFKNTRALVPIGIAVVVLAVLVIGAVSRHHDSTGSAAGGAQGSASSPAAGPAVPAVASALSRGSNSAPVTMTEFGDYQCPGCGRFFQRTESVIFKKYVNTGVVRFQWRDFPWIGKESTRAAIAARAAGRQGKFWEFHDALYAHQPPKNSGMVTDDYLRSIARQLRLDMPRFDKDLSDGALRSAVAADYVYGQKLGATGTPDFVINGKRFFGEQPLSAFEQAIEQARQQA